MFKSGIEELLLKPGATIRDALALIEESSSKIVLLVAQTGDLRGVITDGDIRRALLGGSTLQDTACTAANTNPTVVRETDTASDVRRKMQSTGLFHMPVVDEAGHPVAVWLRYALRGSANKDTAVVLMAGGEGKRLRPMTEGTPKPLLRIGDRPILQHSIEHFAQHGLRRFYISVNYLGHQIEEYFADGTAFGVDINYLREGEKLGTAGSLSLLRRDALDNVIVMNGDILTDADISELAATHVASRASATMAVREHRTQLPFGVVSFEGSSFAGMVEKPTLAHFVNAGLYCLSAEALSVVPEGSPMDMPDLFNRLRRLGRPCAVHPISSGRWIDIGTPHQLELARAAYASREPERDRT